MHRGRRHKLARFGLLVGIFAVSFLLLLEGGLRVAGFPASYSSLFVFDDMLGYRLAPGTHIFPTGQDVYRISVDSDGVVDRSGQGDTDLLILGDGVSAGFELDPDQRLAAQLFARTGQGAINLSVPGYGTVQQALTLKKWLSSHPAPREVLVVFNFANDFYDNVPAWEGTRVPGLSVADNRISLVPPVNPRGVPRVLREILWESRLYALFVAWQNRDLPPETLLPEQAFLFEDPLPEEAEVGISALTLAGAEIRSLAAQYGFRVRWVAWPDRGLLSSEPKLSYERAFERVQDAIGGEMPVCWVTLPEIAVSVPEWDWRWLSPGGRHANAAATRLMADAVAAGGCGG